MSRALERVRGVLAQKVAEDARDGFLGTLEKIDEMDGEAAEAWTFHVQSDGLLILSHYGCEGPTEPLSQDSIVIGDVETLKALQRVSQLALARALAEGRS